MDFFGQVRQGFAKVVQKAAPDFQVFNEFPECSILSSTDKLSIKVKDLSVNSPQWKPIVGTDNQLIYSVRNEDNRKQLLLNAHFHCVGTDQGIVLKNMAGKAIMIVGLPNHSINSLGKLLHPTSATMYKIMCNPGTFDYTVIKSPSNEPIMRIEKVFVSLYPIGKAVGLLSSDCVYWMKRMDGTILGYVRPKLVMKSTTLIVKFTSNQKDAQIRAVMMGVATLLMISRVHPHIRNRLEDTMRIAQIH